MRGVFFVCCAVCALNNVVSAALDHYHSLGFAKLLRPKETELSLSVMEKLGAGNKKLEVDVTSVVCILLSGESVCKLHLLNFALADPFSNLAQLMVFMLQTLTRGLAVSSMGVNAERDRTHSASATQKTYARAKIPKKSARAF